jgi:hypothetical protein
MAVGVLVVTGIKNDEQGFLLCFKKQIFATPTTTRLLPDRDVLWGTELLFLWRSC